MSMFRSWLLYIGQHRLFTRMIIIALIALSIFILLVSIYGWDWTGVNGGFSQITITSINRGTTTATVRPPGKTLWDFLQILIVPIMLFFGGFWLNRKQKSRDQKAEDAQKRRDDDAAKEREKLEREDREDNQRETALQAYIDKISELLLEKKLGESSPEDEVRKVARVRTLTVLPRLDGKRKRNLLLFLYDANLVDKGDQIIDVSDADLSEADLSGVHLYLPKWTRDRKSITMVGADLSGVNLRNANLNGADLGDVKLGAEAENAHELDILSGGNSTKGKIIANLSGAQLIGTDLSRAVLCGVDLSRANLSGANLDGANLQRANLSGANLHKAALSIESFIQPSDGPEDISTWIGADLSGANLSDANLSNANLKQADFRGADLSNANLSGANLSGAKLEAELSVSGSLVLVLQQKANLEGANLEGATMPDGSIHP